MDETGSRTRAWHDTRPLSLSQVLPVVAIGVAVLVVLDLEKRADCRCTSGPRKKDCVGGKTPYMSA